MFNKLLHLHNKNPNKTPLEDYTTELFVGILNNDRKLKNKFCKEFIGLKSDYFNITTQKKYYLEDDNDCIVDIVIENDSELCFIENKVNSKEGYRQLERYAKVLDKYKELNTKLLYCTKYTDVKQINEHSFKQYKWHSLSEFLKHNSKEKLTKLFIKFLNDNDMSNDMIIKGNDIVALENMVKVFKLMNQNIENVVPYFEERFNSIKDLRKGAHLRKQMYDFERYCFMSSPVVKGKGYSEIMFGFEFRGYLFSQIYIHNDNDNYISFKNEISNQSGLSINHYSEYGSRIYIEKNIGAFVNDKNSEEKIKEWFINSFYLLHKFIKETSKSINWSDDILLKK